MLILFFIIFPPIIKIVLNLIDINVIFIFYNVYFLHILVLCLILIDINVIATNNISNFLFPKK